MFTNAACVLCTGRGIGSEDADVEGREAELRSLAMSEPAVGKASSDFAEELEETESRSDPSILRLPIRMQKILITARQLKLDYPGPNKNVLLP